MLCCQVSMLHSTATGIRYESALEQRLFEFCELLFDFGKVAGSRSPSAIFSIASPTVSASPAQPSSRWCIRFIPAPLRPAFPLTHISIFSPTRPTRMAASPVKVIRARNPNSLILCCNFGNTNMTSYPTRRFGTSAAQSAATPCAESVAKKVTRHRRRRRKGTSKLRRWIAFSRCSSPHPDYC